MNYRCPVCMYTALPYPPRDYHICPCCGTEFGNDDADHSNAELRGAWIRDGATWFFGKPPTGWNPWLQLLNAKLDYLIPFRIRVKVPSIPTEYGAVSLAPRQKFQVLST